MFQINAAHYSKTIATFVEMERLAWQLSVVSEGRNSELGEAAKEGLLRNLKDIGSVARAIGAGYTALASDKFEQYVQQEPKLYASLVATNLSEIRQRLLDELPAVRLFFVPDDVGLFDNSAVLFSVDAQAAFPTAVADADEAGKCLALDRFTACVFHVMRAVEAVIELLAVRLGATIRGQSGQTLAWGILTSNIGSKIADMPTGDAKDEWHHAHMFLVSCNRAFRTKTAHPVKSYTGEQAREAFDAARAFVRSAAHLV